MKENLELTQMFDDRVKGGSLNLDGIHLSQSITQLKLYLDNNPSIKNLSIRRCSLKSSDIEILASNQTLTTLDVGENRIGAAGASALAGNRTLTKLDVSSNGIGNAGAIALAGNQTLTALNLSDNNFGNAAVIDLVRNQTLNELNVSHNNIEDSGAIDLAANQKLTKLNASANHISETGAAAFALNQILTTLDLRGNKIGDAARSFTNNITLEWLQIDGGEVIYQQRAHARFLRSTAAHEQLSHYMYPDINSIITGYLSNELTDLNKSHQSLSITDGDKLSAQSSARMPLPAQEIMQKFKSEIAKDGSASSAAESKEDDSSSAKP